MDSAGTVSGWDENARAHIKAVVSLSGPTDLCNLCYSHPDGIPDEQIEDDQHAFDNYVGLPDHTDCEGDQGNKLSLASPAWLVANGATNNPPPIRLYATEGDSVPFTHEDAMFQALFTRYGVTLDVRKYKMSYQYTAPNHHAYKYWHSENDDPSGGNECVGEQVIDFLLDNL